MTNSKTAIQPTLSTFNETKAFIGLKKDIDFHSKKANRILKKISSTNYICTHSIDKSDLMRISWNGEVLPELIPDKENPIHKTYSKSKPFWLASSTQGIPLKESVKAAYLTAQRMQELASLNKITELEQFIASITKRTFIELCKYYKLNEKDTEVIFDDNATLVVYQFLSMIKLKPHPKIVTSVDIGQSLRQTLCGEKPEKVIFGFKSSVDIWNNKKTASENLKPIGPFKTYLINTFSKLDYQSDRDFLKELVYLINKASPEIFLIPTVTSTGRKLPFIKACKKIKSLTKQLGYSPVIILDDAQGLYRLRYTDYWQEKRTKTSHMWDYADAILTTGSKITGALTGTGALLISKKQFKKMERRNFDSSFQFRARKYNFVSTDRNRLKKYNVNSQDLVNIPELASFSLALQKINTSKEVNNKMRWYRKMICEYLQKIPGVIVLNHEKKSYSCVESIITFYLDKYPKKSNELRIRLSEPTRFFSQHLPVTLPKIISTKDIDYLRISLEPNNVINENYVKRLTTALKVIKENIIRNFN